MSRKPKGMTAAEASKLPPQEQPSWYRPATPYAEANTASVTGGYRSPRVYNAVSAALVSGLVETRPDLRSFPEALAAWGDAEARAALLRRHLDEVGLIDDNGEPRSALVDVLSKFERRATTARSQLGLDPRSEAELALLRSKALREGTLAPAIDLDALAERGRAALDSGADPVREVLARVRAEAQQTEESKK